MTGEYGEMSEEEFEEIRFYFDNEIWPKIKKDLKEMTKKEACFFAFLAGSKMMKDINEMQYEILEEELNKMEEKMKGMEGDEIKKLLEQGGNFWEDKTKINGVWVEDKTEEGFEGGTKKD